MSASGIYGNLRACAGHRQPRRPAPRRQGGRGVRCPDRRRQRPLQGHPLPDRLGRRSRHPQLAHRSDARADPRQDLARGLQGAGQARPDLRRLALPSADRRDRRAGRRLSRTRRSSSTMSAARWAMPAMPAGTTRCGRPGRRSMAELAKRQNITVKVGGLGMAMGWFDFYQRPKPPGSQELADAFRPWVETCIELFGAEPLHVREQLPGRQDHVRLRRAVERLQAARRQGLGRREDGPVLRHGVPRLQALEGGLQYASSSLLALGRGIAPPCLAAPFASAQTFKVVMHSDVKALDPVWSGAYITRNHGYMLYDTLFALDEKLQVKPQMVDKWETSPDGLTWTFTLRDGLEFHDGAPVTSEDVHRLAEALGGARFDGPEARGLPAGVEGGRRQDLPDRAEAEVRAVARGARQAVGGGAVHDARRRRPRRRTPSRRATT